MSKLPDKPTNKQFISLSLSELSEWFKKNDINSWLEMTCIYCGRKARENDHVIPRSRGGKNTRDNLVPTCAGCNAEKSTMTPFEWKGIPNESIRFGNERHVKLAKELWG